MNAQPLDLVMLHGWGMNSAVWGDTAASLPIPVAPYPLDLPGHGGAPFDAARSDLVDWADACLSRAPERAVWLGWSLGGLVALQAALQAPKRVRALVLIGSTPRFVQAVDWRVAMPEDLLGQFSEQLLQDPASTSERFLALQVRGSEGERATLRALRAELADQPPARADALAAGLDLLRDGDLRGRLPDVRPPTLWVFGERDTLVPAEVAERVRILMPDAQTRIIQGAGHAPLLSHPGQTGDEIGDFLRTIE
ncbi:MAG: pimeloyl-ACP methyl ester esterase BioH [Thiohalocapsa sp.]|nr:pimeloyl-ACP methyl ester esterase BioH [Thiohalocapsa sp.]MCF7991006.1 pimeloyl-ACP methyl ester esterase BioH [Thiohalocapsa sp.]